MNSHANILQQNKLLHVTPTLAGFTKTFQSAPKGAIYFGFGLTSSKAPTIGFPFDALIFILSAEFLRREFHLEEIHCLIADTHALSNIFCDSRHVNEMSLLYQKMLTHISLVTGIRVTTHLASSFDQSTKYKQILENIQMPEGGLYLHRELADILWFYSFYDVRLKLGWLIHQNEKKAGRDERYFDNAFNQICTLDMSFAYTQAGRTFDENRPYVSPYVSILAENRILIDNTTDVSALHKKFGFSKSKTAHLQSIVNMWDIITPLQTDAEAPLHQRIQNIINTILSADEM